MWNRKVCSKYIFLLSYSIWREILCLVHIVLYCSRWYEMIYSAIEGYFYYIVGIAKNIRQWSEKLRVLYHDLTDVFWWWQGCFVMVPRLLLAYITRNQINGFNWFKLLNGIHIVQKPLTWERNTCITCTYFVRRIE